MATPLSNESRTLLRLLSDGAWHDYRVVKEELANQVPPGRALRAYEVREAARLRHLGVARASEELPMEEKLISGRVALANAALHSMCQRHCETEEGGMLGPKQIRVRPEVLPKLLARYGEPAVRQPTPDEPPEEEIDDAAQEREPAPAPLTGFAADVLRRIVQEAVDASVDYAFGEFQYHLEGYLNRSFADLERLLQRRRPPHEHQRKTGSGQHRRRT